MDTPAYYKLNLNLIQGANKNLPPVQAAKALYALEMLFFFGQKPDELGMTLSTAAQGFYESHEQLVMGYRKNALNGSKNQQTKQARKKSQKKVADFSEEIDPLFLEETDIEF